MYSDKNEIVKHLIQEVEKAIVMLQEWSIDIHSTDDYLTSPEGMKNLAASCMLLEAIGESFKKIDKITHKEPYCPNILKFLGKQSWV